LMFVMMMMIIIIIIIFGKMFFFIGDTRKAKFSVIVVNFLTTESLSKLQLCIP